MKKIKLFVIILLAFCMVAAYMPVQSVFADDDPPAEEELLEPRDDDTYDNGNKRVTFILDGLSQISVRDVSVGGEFEVVENNDTKTYQRGAGLTIAGIEGQWLTASIGATPSEARNADYWNTSETAGGEVIMSVDDTCYIYVTASSSSPSEPEGVTDAEAEAGSGPAPSVAAPFPYAVGDVLKGQAVMVGRYFEPGDSWATFKHTSGPMVKLAQNIKATCITHNRGLGVNGSKFNYVAVVKKVDASKGELVINITYYPASGNNRGQWSEFGGVPGYVNSVQTMYRGNFTVGLPEGYVQLTKSAAPSGTNFLTAAPNNYTLAGAVYNLYTDPGCTSAAQSTSGKAVILTTGSDGKTEVVAVTPGTYYAKEVTASKGFLLDTSVYPVTVAMSNTQSSPAEILCKEEPTYKDPSVFIFKYDPSGEKAWSRLKNAEFTISYYDIAVPYADVENLDPATVNLSGKTPQRKWIFKTRKVDDPDPKKILAGFDWETDSPQAGSDPFYMENGKRVLPLGIYTVEETKAPVGCARNQTVFAGKIYQPSNGKVAARYIMSGKEEDQSLHLEVDVPEIPQHVSLTINKVDAETGHVQGADRAYVKGSLAGAEYDVYFDNDEMSGKEIVGTIVTDENGKGTLTKRTKGRPEAIGSNLEPGIYYIAETQASPGYVIDKYILKDGEQQDLVTDSIEVICDYDDEGTPVTKKLSGSYEDGTRIFRARVQNYDTELFEYSTTSEETAHHTIVSKTDIATGEELPGAKLQVLDSKGNVVESWTSTNEPHDIVALHDETQGLKDGKYILREITAPYGYDVAEDVSFEVRSGEIVNHVKMENKPLTVGTTAIDTETATHHGIKGAEETIKDTVKITGLYEGRTYQVKGVLMDQTTGEAMLDASGNEITAETEPFVATGDEMEVDLMFTVDAADFTDDTTVVAFEKLYRTSYVVSTTNHEDAEKEDKDVPIELAKHEDIDDEAQTIHYGGIVRTTALDKDSASHNILAAGNVVIVDTVQYKNLSTKNKYRLDGTVFDKTTGKLTGETATLDFTPEKPDGEIALEFVIDASALENHDLVIFETLSVITDKDGEDTPVKVDEHANPDDEDQTMHVPQIRTTASDSETKDHIAHGKADTCITDTVSYKNLIVGKTYTMKGTLMNKKTNKPVKVSGHEVTAETTFTPTEKDGTVDITFRFDGTELQGKTVVAFEECLINGVPVAIHADINDEEQSVYIPKIRTKADLDGKIVTDTIRYENLIPGKYVMRGYLVNPDTEKKLKDSDGEFEFEITEAHASGEVEVELPVSYYEKLRGYKLVVFEECYMITKGDNGEDKEILVADHKDSTDRKQTVKIPKAKKPDTGENTGLFIFGGIFAAAIIALAVLKLRKKPEDKKNEPEEK